MAHPVVEGGKRFVSDTVATIRNPETYDHKTLDKWELALAPFVLAGVVMLVLGLFGVTMAAAAAYGTTAAIIAAIWKWNDMRLEGDFA
jgi:uncharacterized membrane protein YphA (DoxX/SURF4 family)